MNRSDKHIDLTLEVVRNAWKAHRDLRLCQLIVDANDGEDPYHVEDGALTKRMKVGPGLEPCRIPEDLDDCFVELMRMLPQEDIDRIKTITEVSMNRYHHGFGTLLRNSWGLWSDSRLAKWFNGLGIYHADDMSGIILTSFWRHMNGKPIRLDEQVEHYKKWWRERGVVNGLEAGG